MKFLIWMDFYRAVSRAAWGQIRSQRGQWHLFMYLVLSAVVVAACLAIFFLFLDEIKSWAE